MNTQHQPDWDQLRAAYQPASVALDTRAIMNAVRDEAKARPLQRVTNAVAAIPTWSCATAASLALLLAAAVVSQAVTQADSQIGQAWIRSVQPDEFAQTFLSFSDDLPL